MIKTTLTIVAATAALALGGCATKAQTGALVGGIAGAAILGPVGGVAAAHYALGATGLVVGAIIGGNIGKSMDEKDQKMAQMAADSGKKQVWVNSSTSTTYVATPTDKGNGTADVKVEATKDSKTTVETSNVKKKIRE